MTRDSIPHLAGNHPLHVGIIGVGEVATKRLLPALTRISDARLVSVLSRNIARGEAISREWSKRGVVETHNSLDLFLADENLDAVIIATPDDLHAAQTIAAIAARKHVFVEKPMATTLADAQHMVDAAEESGVTLAVGYHLRHHAGHRLLFRAIQEGAIGSPKRIDITWTYAAPENDWRGTKEHGGWWSLAAVGTHAIDLAAWLVGEEGGVSDISSVCRRDEDGRDHSASVSLRFANGVEAHIVISNREHLARRISIEGGTGSAEATGTLGAYGKGTIVINGEPLLFTPVDPYEAELRDFICAIQEDRAPKVSGAIGLANVEILSRIS